MNEAATDFIIKLYCRGRFNNGQLIEAYKWISDFIHAQEIKQKVNIEYGSRPEHKRRRAQFFSKKEKELQLKLPELDFSYIEITKLEEVANAFRAFDISFRFSLSQPLDLYLPDDTDFETSGSISFGLNYDIWNGIINDTFIEKVITEFSALVNKGKTKVIYGMVVKMPRSKSAYFYINGIGNFNLSEEEDNWVSLFNSEKIADKFWEPFWGNIITQKHLRNKNQYKELISLVGKNNVTEMGNDMIFFKMPVSISAFEYGSPLHAKYKNIIHELFAKYDADLSA